MYSIECLTDCLLDCGRAVSAPPPDPFMAVLDPLPMKYENRFGCCAFSLIPPESVVENATFYYCMSLLAALVLVDHTTTTRECSSGAVPSRLL